jgi:hypothetical protein
MTSIHDEHHDAMEGCGLHGNKWDPAEVVEPWYKTELWV